MLECYLNFLSLFLNNVETEMFKGGDTNENFVLANGKYTEVSNNLC
jgi:hypothetical protein